MTRLQLAEHVDAVHVRELEVEQDQRTAGVPVVALTATRLGDDESIRAAGFSGRLEKPIAVRDFPGHGGGYVQSAPVARLSGRDAGIPSTAGEQGWY